MTILYIIGILFLALVIIVPLLEKSKWRMSGEDMSKLPDLLVAPGVHLHLYGKAEAKPGRKMGHYNSVRPKS